MQRTDVVAGAVVTLVGVVALALALNWSFFAADGTPGPGFFPVLLSAALVVLGVVLAVQGVRPARIEVRAIGAVSEVEKHGDGGDEGEPLLPDRRKPLVIGALFVVALPLLSVLGFVPAMVLLMLAVLYGVERRRGVWPAVAALVVPIGLYELFVELLGIQLPTGMLGLGVLGI